jgi:predicted aspartyl protease
LNSSERGAAIEVIHSETDALMIMPDKNGQTVGVSAGDREEQEFSNVYYINENNLYGCLHVELNIGGEKLMAVLDTGAEISLMLEKIFEDLLAKGVKAPQLPVVNGALTTAFGNKTKRIKRQALIEFEIDGVKYEQVFMISPNLEPDTILGINLLQDNDVVIDVTEKCFRTRTGEVSCTHSFVYNFLQKDRVGVRSVLNQNEKKNLAVVKDDNLKSSFWQALQKGLKNNYRICKLDGLDICAEISESNVISDVSCKERTIRVDNFMSSDTNFEFVKSMLTNNDVEVREQEKEANPCGNAERLSESKVELESGADVVDARTLDVRILCKKVDESDELTCSQKESLKCMLLKYKAQFTSKPGLCKLIEYEFEVQGSDPLVGHTRPIPFSVRPAVREQIRQMTDGVLEVSNSSYVNPLTIVMKEGREPRICVDSRKINKYTLPDRARAPPIQELLRQFHGSKFITSIDLSSTFLQIGLKKESRKYTAFLFESQLYLYTRCAFGCKNSLSAFVRALKLTLGPDTYEYATAYVDDIIVHSPTFELHLKHLDDVLGKLTQAGFTVNAEKCNFCETENSFWYT